ncbi:MAG: hypothetical protein ACR2OH_07165 [Microthrixaceae bacterium]
MSALFIGFFLVVASAAMFGFALFGRRPIPQPAMVGTDSPRQAVAGSEAAPSRLPTGKVTAAQVAGTGPVIVKAPSEPGHIGSTDVRVPLIVRLRSALLLAVSVLGTAIIVGVLLSIIVVGAIILVA